MTLSDRVRDDFSRATSRSVARELDATAVRVNHHLDGVTQVRLVTTTLNVLIDKNGIAIRIGDHEAGRTGRAFVRF